MELTLTLLPDTLRSYTSQPVPQWMRRLHPDAAASIMAIEKETGGLSYTDMFRTAEVSLHARATKQGVQPPGYSAHNYGLAIDIDVAGTKKLRGWTYDDLWKFMESRDWYCHRRDHKEGSSEYWHFNFLTTSPEPYLAVVDPSPSKSGTWALGVEKRIVELYGDSFKLSPQDVQGKLQQLKMYNGPLDGIIGPISRQAILVFQTAWDLTTSGIADDRTQRTLAFVTATQKLNTWI